MEPQSRMLDLHKGETGPEAIAQIEEQGGIAWVRPEYGSDMGHENVYWGERLFFFTPEAIQQRKAAGASAPAIKLFVSHSARDGQGNVKWFVVEPQSDPSDQVASLRASGRTVIEVGVNAPTSRVEETLVEDEEPPLCEKCGERHYKRGPFRPTKRLSPDSYGERRDEILWGADAPVVRVISDALFGQHPERGGQEREQAAFAIVQALRAANLLNYGKV